jgi:ABC-2 type transport system permease protein
MNELASTIWIEARKATRSRVPPLTALAFMIMPLACALLMFIYKDPEFAREAGIISAKANLMGGTADWPTYLDMLAQAMAVGGFILFSFIAIWVFGREFVDGTLKDLLAVPVSRSAILLGKFIVAGAWSAALAVLVYLAGLGLGALVGLPQGSGDVLVRGSLTLAVTAGLVIIAVLPIAFFASAGRGYLLPFGVAVLLVALAQILALLGWGSYFPWSVPALYAGLANKGGELGPASYWIVLLTGLAGIIGTDLWWKNADQNR